uniref:Uncharacterized protein n=1 Tax=Myoviridae sp. ctLEM34 TaxID=2825082 RepID=A0A8S5TR52_9CAUD|nr:MAG TPA: hypothetical protein [Myoviridae sp. ctLEM34]
MKTIKTLVDYTKSKKKHQLEKKDYFYIYGAQNEASKMS